MRYTSRIRRFGVRALVVLVATMAMAAVSSEAHAAVTCANVHFMNNVTRKWVSAEVGYPGPYNGMLRARADTVGPWEEFTWCEYPAYWTLQSKANNKYVSVELGYGNSDLRYGMLRARATTVGPWEKFTRDQNTAYVLFTLASQANGMIVAAELNYDVLTDLAVSGVSMNIKGMLRARTVETCYCGGKWEVFIGSAI
jgi:hypothetical protein